MGWYYTQGASRADVIRELTPAERKGEDGAIFRTLRHCCRGNVLFSLHESVTPDGNSTKWIGVDLMQKSLDGFGWGHKPMDESMGPYYYNCPVAYLDEASEPVNETAANWRAEVRRVAAEKAKQDAKRPSVGEIWSCTGKNCKRIRITKVEGRRIEAVNLTGGGYYRIPKKMLGERMAEGGN
jgi:hypothetical protein